MAPTSKIHQYEITYTHSDFGIPHITVPVWEKPSTEEEKAYFILAPEAEVLICDPETCREIQRRSNIITGLWAAPHRWGHIQSLLKQDSSVPLAELEKKRFRVAITRELWEVPHPRMLIRIVGSIREKNRRRNRQIEDLKKESGTTG